MNQISASHDSVGVTTNFPNIEKISAPNDRLPQIKVNGVAKISPHVTATGMEVILNNKRIRVNYPPGIWKRFPKIHKKILSQNLAFGSTFHIPYLYTTIKRMVYNQPIPLSESFFFKGLSLALPSTAIMQTHKDKRITSNLLRRLFDIDYSFSNQKTEIPPYNRTSLPDHAIMPFTFGKDSLLTFALSKELGLTVYPVYITEPYSPYETHIKKILSKPFKKEFRVQINFMKNSLGVLREPTGWFGWELQLTQYSLMLLPYVYAKRAGLILFSNEQSCDDTTIDDDGFRFNPVFEQSHSWLLQNSLMASVIGGNSLSIGSLLEPVHEIAIEHILHKRYPEIGKYQSSCDLYEKPKTDGRWCENCSKCARMYIFLLAVGVNPKNVGFKRNLLKSKYQHLYTIFDTGRIHEFGYDQSQSGRQEQILAFHMAYKKNVKGPVMTSYARRFLTFARKNEKKLRQKFFGLHSTKTVPSDIRQKVLRIFRNELKDQL